jgi:hypothetical protein
LPCVSSFFEILPFLPQKLVLWGFCLYWIVLNLLVALFFLSGGAIAQLGERLLCKQEVSGSIPLGSTKNKSKMIEYGWKRKLLF